MQGGRSGRDPFSGFSDPFAGFGGFGSPPSILSGFFGGRDPFDDPFFTRPFGGMFETSLFDPAMSPFTAAHASGFLDRQPPRLNNSRGPIIEELNSDDESADAKNEKKANPRKHRRSSSEPYVEDPNNKAQGKKSKQIQCRDHFSTFNNTRLQPQGQSFTFESSTVSYGGANGTYYTSSRTRRTGSDGLTFEESKEADTAARRATHQISRGIHDKGHTVTRKLNPDGRVDTMQTLHNLNEDELSGFEESWKGKAREHVPGWSQRLSGQEGMVHGMIGQNDQASGIGWALPSAVLQQSESRRIEAGRRAGRSSQSQHTGSQSAAADIGGRISSSQKRIRSTKATRAYQDRGH